MVLIRGMVLLATSDQVLALCLGLPCVSHLILTL